VFVRGVQAFSSLCRHLRARELSNGSRSAFVGTRRAAHVQTSSFLHVCICKAAGVSFFGLRRVFVRGVRAFHSLCRHLRARELPNGSRGAFVGTRRAAHVQTSSFVRLG
jgi:hypothetical protein